MPRQTQGEASAAPQRPLAGAVTHAGLGAPHNACCDPHAPQAATQAPPSARKVTRLHGELHAALCAEAARLGLRPATLAAHILQTQLAGGGAGEGALHPLTEAYLPTHNPRVTPHEKARTVTITAPVAVFEAIGALAEQQAAAEGHQKDGDAAEKRNFGLATAEWTRKIQTSLLVAYLDKYHAL